MQPIYKRVILKLSGEALAGSGGTGFDYTLLDDVAAQLARITAMGVQTGVVVGGGNFWRGRQGAAASMDATTADHMGMLGTAINALALQDFIERKGVPCRVQSAADMRTFAETYARRKAEQHLAMGRCVVFACGTGNPFFTTDSAAALRASELSADIVLKATNIDGVYAEDPRKNPNAARYERLTFKEAIDRQLGVMDNTAFAMCMNANIPIFVFRLESDALIKAVCGEARGTLVERDGRA